MKITEAEAKLSDHQFGIEFIAKMLRLVQGGDFSPPVNESLRCAASDAIFSEPLQTLERRMAAVRQESFEAGKEIGENCGPLE